MNQAQKKKVIKPLYTHWKKMPGDTLRAVLLDFKRWCAEGKLIINKQGHAVPFILNEAQEKVAELILSKAFAPIPEPVILVIHKSRQMGISVVLAALEQYIVDRKQNLNITHLFPDEQLASQFFNEKWQPLAEGTHPQLLPDMYPTITPVPYIKVGDFLGHNMNCNIKIGGAGSPAAGRSGTQHVVILDEYAFYPNVNSLERGVLATQPKTGMVMTIYVSTANGMNWFYDTVKQAEKSTSRMEHLFLPWHLLKEYEMDVKPGSRFYDLDLYKPTEYDMKLMDIFEQAGYPTDTWLRKLEWYDHVLEVEAKGDQDFMFQEYPSEPQESFEVTGRPALPAKVINYWLEKNKDDKLTYVDQFSQMDPKTKRPKIVIQPTNKSAVRMYRPPMPGHRYILGCDPSEGDYAGDRSAWVILDMNTMEEVCFSADYLEAEELADTLINYARYYNNAMVVVERNMGQAVIEFLLASNYHRIYVDPLPGKVKYGVRTTQATKNEALRRLRFLLNNGFYKPHDSLFLEEAQHFSWRQLPGGSWRVEATGTDENGQPYHDDTIMARAVLSLALDMRKWKGYYDKQNTQRVIK